MQVHIPELFCNALSSQLKLIMFNYLKGEKDLGTKENYYDLMNVKYDDEGFYVCATTYGGQPYFSIFHVQVFGKKHLH